MRILRSLLQAHDAIATSMQLVVDDALAEGPELTPVPGVSSIPPGPSSGPTLVVDVPHPSTHPTRAMPKVTSAVFEEYVASAWRNAVTPEQKQKVLETLQTGADRGILDASAIDRLVRLTS